MCERERERGGGEGMEGVWTQTEKRHSVLVTVWLHHVLSLKRRAVITRSVPESALTKERCFHRFTISDQLFFIYIL